MNGRRDAKDVNKLIGVTFTTEVRYIGWIGNVILVEESKLEV